MNVGSIMRGTVVTVRRETPLREVARLLVEHAISGVPVVDDAGMVVGVVSEADFVIRERGAVPGRARLFDRLFGGESRPSTEELAKLHATTAGEAMTAPAITVAPDAALSEAARIMVARAINRLPVVADGRLVGIVSRADLVRAFVRTDEDLRTAIVEDVIRRSMWLDDRELGIEVLEGRVRITGTLEKRSDADILQRLLEQVPGVIAVDVDTGWRIDDADIEAPALDLVGPPSGRY
jgi:CBS domain-containing protein